LATCQLVHIHPEVAAAGAGRRSASLGWGTTKTERRTWVRLPPRTSAWWQRPTCHHQPLQVSRIGRGLKVSKDIIFCFLANFLDTPRNYSVPLRAIEKHIFPYMPLDEICDPLCARPLVTFKAITIRMVVRVVFVCAPVI
jgi:hypothetical protein